MSFQRRFAGFFAIALLVAFFYNNCAARKDMVGTGTMSTSPSSTPSTDAGSSVPPGYTPPGGTTGSTTTDSTLRGFVDGVHGDLIYGWACAVGKSQTLQVVIKIDGVQVAQIATGVDSEPVISSTAYCNTNFSKHRFLYRIADAQYASLAGKIVQVFAVNPTTNSQTAELANGGLTYHVGDQPFWYSQLPTGYVGTPRSAPSANLAGYWESFSLAADGSFTVAGWACVLGDAESVALAILTTQNEFVAMTYTLAPSSSSEASAINSSCQSNYSLRRFAMTVPASTANNFRYKIIKLALAEPLVANSYYSELAKVSNFNSQLGTGTPTPTPTATATPTPNTSCQPFVRTEQCAFIGVCPNNSNQVILSQAANFEMQYNLTATPGSPAITVVPSQVSLATAGYTLSQISGVQFACTTAMDGTPTWQPLYFNSACAVQMNVTDSTPGCSSPGGGY